MQVHYYSTREATFGALAIGSFIAALILCILFAASCSPTAKTAENTIVRIAQDVCDEEDQQPDEKEWVKLFCAGVHVVFPRAQWVEMKRDGVRAIPLDAGSDQ